jgi:hypothetical protein
VNQFTITTYGQGPVDFELSETAPPEDLLENLLTEKAKLNRSGMKYYHAQNQPQIGYKFEHCNDGFGYFYFENGSNDTTLTATVDLVQMEGCELRKIEINRVSAALLWQEAEGDCEPDVLEIDRLQNGR